MRYIEEIKQCKRLNIVSETDNGFSGYIQMPLWSGTVVCSWDFWDHVSVSPSKNRIIPSWDDMCMIEDIFFREDEAVIQIHPPKDEYVNNKPNCLHLWRWNEGEMILPPSFMVGLRNGQTPEELNMEIKKYYKEHGKEYSG